MPNINEQQFSQWSNYLTNWQSVVRKNAAIAIFRAELQADIHVFLDQQGQPLTVFTDQNLQDIQKLIDIHNRIERANTAVEDGIYGLRFHENEIEIIAPSGMNPEQYQEDLVTGYGILPIIWVAVVGAAVVGALWATSKIINSHATKIQADSKKQIIAADKAIAQMPKAVQDAYKAFKEANKPKIEKAGLLDDLLGSGSGGMIAAAVGIGVVLFAFAASRRN